MQHVVIPDAACRNFRETHGTPFWIKSQLPYLSRAIYHREVSLGSLTSPTPFLTTVMTRV